MDTIDARADRIIANSHAATLFTWAGDTQTDLLSFFDLTDGEFETIRLVAELQLPGCTETGGPDARPTCGSCGVTMVARGPKDLTPEAAVTGIWWDHPRHAGHAGLGHVSSYSMPLPTRHAAVAAEANVKAGHGW